MKKTIKIIDLLNLIANGKEVPKEIKYKNEILYFDYETTNYFNDEDMHSVFCGTQFILNDEIEIINEEEFEDIEPLVLRTFERTGQAITTDRLEDYCDYNFEMIENKIAKIVLNQKKIIDTINELKGKSE